METRGRFNKDEARLDSMETHCSNMNATMKNLESQLEQLANELKNQQKGKFSSDIVQNPRDHCKAITLRSGKEVESSRQREQRREKEKTEKEVETEQDRPAEVVPTPCSKISTRCREVPKSRGISFSDNPPIISPPLPYPQRFQKKKLDTQFSKFLKIFKKIHVNIPFADSLEQMPNYAMFMKEVMTIKRKLEDYKTIKLTEECRAMF